MKPLASDASFIRPSPVSNQQVEVMQRMADLAGFDVAESEGMHATLSKVRSHASFFEFYLFVCPFSNLIHHPIP